MNPRALVARGSRTPCTIRRCAFVHQLTDRQPLRDAGGGAGVLGDQQSRPRQATIEEGGVELGSTEVTRAANSASVTARVVAVVSLISISRSSTSTAARMPKPVSSSTMCVLTSGPPAQAREQRQRLDQRQADDIAVGAVDRRHEGRSQALDRIAAGLARPFAAGEVGVESRVRSGA